MISALGPADLMMQNPWIESKIISNDRLFFLIFPRNINGTCHNLCPMTPTTAENTASTALDTNPSAFPSFSPSSHAPPPMIMSTGRSRNMVKHCHFSWGKLLLTQPASEFIGRPRLDTWWRWRNREETRWKCLWDPRSLWTFQTGTFQSLPYSSSPMCWSFRFLPGFSPSALAFDLLDWALAFSAFFCTLWALAQRCSWSIGASSLPVGLAFIFWALVWCFSFRSSTETSYRSSSPSWSWPTCPSDSSERGFRFPPRSAWWAQSFLSSWRSVGGVPSNCFPPAGSWIFPSARSYWECNKLPSQCTHPPLSHSCQGSRIFSYCTCYTWNISWWLRAWPHTPSPGKMNWKCTQWWNPHCPW